VAHRSMRHKRSSSIFAATGSGAPGCTSIVPKDCGRQDCPSRRARAWQTLPALGVAGVELRPGRVVVCDADASLLGRGTLRSSPLRTRPPIAGLVRMPQDQAYPGQRYSCGRPVAQSLLCRQPRRRQPTICHTRGLYSRKKRYLRNPPSAATIGNLRLLDGQPRVACVGGMTIGSSGAFKALSAAREASCAQTR
jgi:hypothetical protein